MNSNEVIYTYRITREVHAGGSSCLMLLCWIAGMACFIGGIFGFVIILWPFGLVLLVLAYFTRSQSRWISTCGHCGNEVSPTSNLCPTCHADMAPEPAAKRWWRSF